MVLLGAVPALASGDHGGDAAGASALAANQWVAGEIDPAGDKDWFRFAAVSGTDYVFETRSPSPMDTTLTLIDRDGRTALAFDDDGGGGRASRIAWRAPRSATCYLVVAHYDGQAGSGRYEIGAATSAAANPSGLTLSIDAPRLYDPKLGASPTGANTPLPIDVAVDPAGATYDVDLEVRDASGAAVQTILAAEPLPGGTVYRASFDGTAGSGGLTIDPGTYTLRLTARAGGSSVAAVLERDLFVVRLGAIEVSISPVAGTGIESDYLFHAAGGVAGSYKVVLSTAPEWRIGGAGGSSDPGDLDRSDGRPRPSPAPWTDTGVPPAATTRSLSLPAIISEGATPEVTVKVGSRPVSERSGAAVSPGYPLAPYPVRALVNGIAAAPEGLSPGGSARAALSQSLSASVGEEFLDLGLRFEYREGGRWLEIPGEQEASVRIYTVLGPARLAPSGVASGAPYLPWLAVVDQVAGWVAGQASDEEGVEAIVADGVFGGLGLAYDTVAGAPAYAMGNLDDLELELSQFIGRAYGRWVNCSDCATITATYANMVGADLDYAILGWYFDLNYVKPIGGSSFTNDPFNTGWPGGFSFHAISTCDGAITVHDATLSVDDDSRPQAPPHVEARPRGMGLDHYRQKLTPDSFSAGLARRPRLR